MSLSDVVDLLACPRCGEPLQLEERTLRCPARHSYDVARQGYVNLLQGGQPANADTPAMLAARERFLAGGHYDPIAEAVREFADASSDVAEAGAGTGFYLAHALPTGARGVALDVSVAAAKACARQPGRIGSVVADTWRPLPLRTAALDAVLAIFAPKNLAEFARVLRPGGRLITVAPTDEHLAEARDALGLLGIEAGKSDKLDRDAAAWFGAPRRIHLRYTVALEEAAVADLVAMGPNAFHTHSTPTAAQSVTVGVDVACYERAATS